jgi:hypothetical protein
MSDEFFGVVAISASEKNSTDALHSTSTWTGSGAPLAATHRSAVGSRY